MTHGAMLSPADALITEVFDWGTITWMVSGPLGNSSTMTVGRSDIFPGRQNTRHYHPNCDEVLHVIQGTIEHACDDDLIRMGPGDTISIPSGVVHNARNVGEDVAVLVIAYSSAMREAIFLPEVTLPPTSPANI